MVPEARLESTEHGLVPKGDGWFVLNAREARWLHGEGRGALLSFEGETEFPQVGINIFVLPPGEPTGMYHWEADQEDFLVLFGEALLIIEGEKDHTVPWAIANASFHRQRDNPGVTEIVEMAGRGHALTIDSGWREVAETALAFVRRFV